MEGTRQRRPSFPGRTLPSGTWIPDVFGALVDARRGDRFVVAPDGAYGMERGYLPGTNVPETTFTRPEGACPGHRRQGKVSGFS